MTTTHRSKQQYVVVKSEQFPPHLFSPSARRSLAHFHSVWSVPSPGKSGLCAWTHLWTHEHKATSALLTFIFRSDKKLFLFFSFLPCCCLLCFPSGEQWKAARKSVHVHSLNIAKYCTWECVFCLWTKNKNLIWLWEKEENVSEYVYVRL